MTDATPTHQRPEALVQTVIHGGIKGPSFAVLREVVAYRSVLYALIRRAITTRYRQSYGGLIWILGGPLSTAAGYTLFLGGFADVQGDKGSDYMVFTLVGTIVWGIFSRGGIGGMNSLVVGGAFVKKVYFPRVMLPMAAVGQSLADLVPSAVMMLGVSWALGEQPRLSWLLVVVPFFTVTVLSAAFAMAASAVNVYVRDLNYATPIITQFGMLASAVVFPLTAVPERYRTLYAIANPIVGAIDGARAVIYRHDGLDPFITISGIVWSSALLLGAFLLFSVLERDAADRI